MHVQPLRTVMHTSSASQGMLHDVVTPAKAGQLMALLRSGELEIGFNMSEKGRQASRDEQLAVGHKISLGQLNDSFYY